MLSLDLSWVAFIITGLGTLFLLGELLVNMKGIFAIVGTGFITLYFMAYLEPGMFFLMLSLYILGIILIIIDGKVLNDGTLSVIGMVCMLLTVGFSAPSWVTGAYGAMGVLIGAGGSLLFLKVFPKRKMWGKIALVDRLTSEAGYNSINESYHYLIGKEGVTLTPFRPVGTIQVEGKEYSAISNGQWLEKNDKIVVDKVDGTRILVRKIGD
ncbi:NfeD family protein [Bacillaceae bacterium S4-13-58]